MPVARRVRRRSERATPERGLYTIDASGFVNAFNPHEEGHEESLAVLTAIQDRGDPIIVPPLLLPGIAAAVTRATGDRDAAIQYVHAAAALPHLTLVGLTLPLARQALELSATHRLRGADAVYVAVARRYGTVLVSRDQEQVSRGSIVVACQTPEDALADAR
jgi:predicted nucleic acid-binding protein